MSTALTHTASNVPVLPRGWIPPLVHGGRANPALLSPAAHGGGAGVGGRSDGAHERGGRAMPGEADARTGARPWCGGRRGREGGGQSQLLLLAVASASLTAPAPVVELYPPD